MAPSDLGQVKVLGDVVTARCGVALVVDLEHRDVCHKPRGNHAVPVFLTRLEEEAVAGTDDLDGVALRRWGVCFGALLCLVLLATLAVISLQAKDAEKMALRPVQLDMTFASMGGEGPIAYEVLLHAAAVGKPSHFARQDALEETWRVVQPLIDAPPPVEAYEPGTWGPSSADDLVRDHGGWRQPWLPEAVT